MDKIKDLLKDDEDIIFSGNPNYKARKDYLTFVSLTLVIFMEISLYISIRPSLHYFGLKVFIIVFFCVETIYLYFSLRSKKFNKIRYQKDLFYCLTNKRIFTYIVDSNSLMIEKLERCCEISSEMVEKNYGTVRFYDENKEIIMSFDCVSNPEEVVKKALKARDELR